MRRQGIGNLSGSEGKVQEEGCSDETPQTLLPDDLERPLPGSLRYLHYFFVRT